MNLRVNVAGIELETPVLIASGIFGYGREYEALASVEGVGGVMLKTVTLEPRAGNAPACRTVETPSGMLNSIGLENVGLEAFVREKLPQARELSTKLFVSIAGFTSEEFGQLAQRLDGEAGISALELNISCPNVEKGGLMFGCDPDAAAQVVACCRQATKLPLIPKLTPNITDITVVARACEAAGADAISLINTISGMAINVQTRRPRLGNDFGGLSGPAIRPAAVLRVFQVARAVKLPVIGMGGIWDAEDALEFILAGATAVAVGTALFLDPGRPHHIMEGIKTYLREQGVEDLRKLIGSVTLNQLHREVEED